MKSSKSANHKITKSQNRKFTLIEVLMVCALLAFLMAIMVGGYSIAMTKMAEADCISTIQKIATALETYKAKTGYYIQAASAGQGFYIDKPTNVQDFVDFLPDYEKMKKTSAELHPDGERYILVDPYGSNYIYRCPGTHNRMSFDLESAGPDGDFAETADNIKNWE
jgi:general secretion pathway protein G